MAVHAFLPFIPTKSDKPPFPRSLLPLLILITTTSLLDSHHYGKGPFLFIICLLLYTQTIIVLGSGSRRGCEKRMLKKLLSRPKSKKKKEAASSALPTLDRLHETLEMLEKKERFLQKKSTAEVEKAKDYTKAKNKNAAIQCLKKKKLYETQIEQLSNFQLRVHDQIIMLESAKATSDTVDALRSGSSAVNAIQQSLSIDDIENAIEEANEQTENMKLIQEALATPVGASADFNEDELEAELEDLEEEELNQQLPEPPARISVESSASATTSSQPAKDLAELTKLQAEMAL